MNTRPAVRLLAAALIASAGLSGCQQGRATHRIEAAGDHALWMRDYQTAITEYREVINRQPHNWRARISLARAYVGIGRADAAREQMEVVYTIKPNELGVIDLLAESMIESADVDAMAGELRRVAEERQRLDDWLRFGRFMQKAGDLDEAEQALLTAARIDQGRSTRVQLALAEYYAQIGDEASALDRYRMALYLEPSNRKIQDAIRAFGEIPGPTYALIPAESPDKPQ